MISYVSQSLQTTNLGVRGSNPFGRAIFSTMKHVFRRTGTYLVHS